MLRVQLLSSISPIVDLRSARCSQRGRGQPTLAAQSLPPCSPRFQLGSRPMGVFAGRGEEIAAGESRVRPVRSLSVNSRRNPAA
jgi:hypothetical protein